MNYRVPIAWHPRPLILGETEDVLFLANLLMRADSVGSLAAEFRTILGAFGLPALPPGVRPEAENDELIKKEVA